MTSASRVILFDVNWNPSHDEQALARVIYFFSKKKKKKKLTKSTQKQAYRIGQKKKVVVYRLHMLGAIEEKIYEGNVRKQGLAKYVFFFSSFHLIGPFVNNNIILGEYLTIAQQKDISQKQNSKNIFLIILLLSRNLISNLTMTMMISWNTSFKSSFFFFLFFPFFIFFF